MRKKQRIFTLRIGKDNCAICTCLPYIWTSFWPQKVFLFSRVCIHTTQKTFCNFTFLLSDILLISFSICHSFRKHLRSLNTISFNVFSTYSRWVMDYWIEFLKKIFKWLYHSERPWPSQKKNTFYFIVSYQIHFVCDILSPDLKTKHSLNKLK